MRVIQGYQIYAQNDAYAHPNAETEDAAMQCGQRSKCMFANATRAVLQLIVHYDWRGSCAQVSIACCHWCAQCQTHVSTSFGGRIV